MAESEADRWPNAPAGPGPAARAGVSSCFRDRPALSRTKRVTPTRFARDFVGWITLKLT